MYISNVAQQLNQLCLIMAPSCCFPNNPLTVMEIISHLSRKHLHAKCINCDVEQLLVFNATLTGPDYKQCIEIQVQT